MKKIIPALLLVLTTFAARAQYENTKIKTGEKAPQLTLTNPEDKKLSLQDITKGKVVLIDFWASWCRPCRMANPRLVQLYERYKDKSFKNAPGGFTIVSISLDQKKDAWVKAITDDGLVWPYHLSDLAGWKSEAALTYGVEFIPQAFLVGPDGKILAKYNFAEQAEADLQKMLK